MAERGEALRERGDDCLRNQCFWPIMFGGKPKERVPDVSLDYTSQLQMQLVDNDTVSSSLEFTVSNLMLSQLLVCHTTECSI